MRGVESAVVFHADDFGMNRAVTEEPSSVLRGLLTSTSLLANGAGTRRKRSWRVAALDGDPGGRPLAFGGGPARLDEPDHPFELGIHLNLTQGAPLTAGYRGTARRGGVFLRYRTPLSLSPPAAPRLGRCVRAELCAPIEFLLDHRFTPTHVNGHQYIELLPGLRAILRALLERYQIGTLRVVRDSRFSTRPCSPGDSRQIGCWGTSSGIMRGACADAGCGTLILGSVFRDVPRRACRPRPRSRFLAAGKRMRQIEIGLHPAVPNEEGGRTRPVGTTLWPSGGRMSSTCWRVPRLRDLLEKHGFPLGRLNGSKRDAAARAA